MANGGMTGKRIHHPALGEGIADEAERAVAVEVAAVEGDHAGRLLAAVLQGMQAQDGMRGGIRVAIDREDAALLAEAVGVPGQAIDHRVPFLRLNRAATAARVRGVARGRNPCRDRGGSRFLWPP